MKPEESLEKLIEGNKRFAENSQTFPDTDHIRRRETATEGQNPFAVIVSCSDSRTAPEYFFDQGIGSLFVIRTAGNVVSSEVIGSVELGVDMAGASFIGVVGHSGCGVMNMAVKNLADSEHHYSLIDRVMPVLEKVISANSDMPEEQLINELAKENAVYSAEKLLSQSKILSEYAASGKIKVAAGYYDLHSGLVEWL